MALANRLRQQGARSTTIVHPRRERTTTTIERRDFRPKSRQAMESRQQNAMESCILKVLLSADLLPGVISRVASLRSAAGVFL